MTNRLARRRNGLLWFAGAGLLLLGFADLVRGGATLASILLVVGYLVLVPLSLWFTRREDAPPTSPHRQRIAAEEPAADIKRRRLTPSRRGFSSPRPCCFS